MQRNKERNRIYLHTFGMFLAIYLVLMIGFSAFLVSQEKNSAAMELRAYALQANSKVESILQNHLDGDGNLSDLSKVKEDLLLESPLFTLTDSEVAVFTGDHELLFNTANYWRCTYSKAKKGTTVYMGDAYLNPKDWFGEEKTREIEGYMYANPQPEKEGDLSGYIIHLRGFWLDNGMIIPDKITVSSMYARMFDEEGHVMSSSGSHIDSTIYHSDYENTRDLPYFEEGYIPAMGIANPNSKERDDLRQMVAEPLNLKEEISGTNALEGFAQRIGGITYRYYVPIPYQNTVSLINDNRYMSEFWTVVGRDINIGERCLSTLIFVWISCLITFGIAAFILARQALKTYRQQEALENQRKEMTNALAHDLKTPLSIISGYAENLQENIHTEKRAHYATYIQANVKRMDQIIRNLLELSRLEADALRLDIEDVALSEVCKIIVERYKPVWEEKGIRASLDGEAVIKADQALILRVIDNFFVNALDNTPAGGCIDIRIGDGSLEVFNSGSSIPENRMEEIWLPFKKADSARNNSKGTGMGLAIARTILELHKFSYGAANREDGVVFWFGFR